jgi:glucosamine--fructose-6-phosphate aminotransferase (isomerizing)
MPEGGGKVVKESLLAREIAEQADVVGALWREERQAVRAIGREVRARDPRLGVVVARGTSDHAATYGKYLLEGVARLPVGMAAPSLFTLYQTPPRLDGALVVALSQSGASPDVVEVVSAARRQGAITVAVVNDTASPLADAAEHVVFCHAGAERSVAATKSYTAQLLGVAMLVDAIAPEAGLADGLTRVEEWVHTAQSRGAEITAMLAGRAQEDTACLVAGRGFQYATALELALKLKEMAQVLAQGYSAADLRHGPITLVGSHLPVILVSSLGPSAQDMRELAERCADLGARLWGITDDPELASRLDASVMPPPGVPEALAPIVSAPLLQWWAYGTARARGVDPDRPAAIQKVTRTR